MPGWQERSFDREPRRGRVTQQEASAVPEKSSLEPSSLPPHRTTVSLTKHAIFNNRALYPAAQGQTVVSFEKGKGGSPRRAPCSFQGPPHLLHLWRASVAPSAAMHDGESGALLLAHATQKLGALPPLRPSRCQQARGLFFLLTGISRFLIFCTFLALRVLSVTLLPALSVGLRRGRPLPF